MSDERMVPMSAEQHADIERYIVALMRANKNESASRMMNLALAYRFAAPSEPVVPDNVVPLYPEVTHAGDNWSRKAPSA